MWNNLSLLSQQFIQSVSVWNLGRLFILWDIAQFYFTYLVVQIAPALGTGAFSVHFFDISPSMEGLFLMLPYFGRDEVLWVDLAMPHLESAIFRRTAGCCYQGME